MYNTRASLADRKGAAFPGNHREEVRLEFGHLNPFVLNPFVLSLNPDGRRSDPRVRVEVCPPLVLLTPT